MPDPRKVFVIHGRDERLRKGMFDFLRSIDLAPLEWSEAVALTRKASPYVGEILDAAFFHAQAVVVLLSPDDEARLRAQLQDPNDPSHEKNLTPQARPNVLFEAGMAMARHSDRTVLVEIGKLRPFSDVGGRHTIRMDNSTQRRQDLAQRLNKAGCPVNLSGTDWQTAGDLNPPSLLPTPSRKNRGAEQGETLKYDITEQGLISARELISELESNLKLAQNFQSKSHLLKPATAAWMTLEGQLVLPPVLRSELQSAYEGLNGWRALLEQHRGFNIYEREYGDFVDNVAHVLPKLIEKLRKLFP